MHDPARLLPCAICGTQHPPQDMVQLSSLRPSLQEYISRRYPHLEPHSHICPDELTTLRNSYLTDMLEEEKGELTQLEEDVLRSLREQDLLSSNVNEDYSDSLTLGERLADRLATFGGSWTFIIIFAAVLTGWTAWNAWRGSQAFDPFPFILLNLILSCLAALQAPVIMMSQNRQEAKDRLRAENDYLVNLKSELEVRHLNEKMDYLLTRQWQRLLEIQHLQVQLMEEVRAGMHPRPEENTTAGEKR